MPDLPPPPAPDPGWTARWQAARERLSTPAARVAAAAGGAVAVVVLLAVALVAWRGAPPPAELTLPRVATTVPPTPGAPPAGAEEVWAYVHVAGAVARPGLYRLDAAARVADVLDAAGGPTPEADVDQVNLAARVADGERLYVPARGEAPPPPAAGAAATPAPAPGRPLDLNSATAEQLEDLPGVGPSTALAIVEQRRRAGRFRSVDDLLDVPGIGPAKLAQLRPLVRV